MLYFPKAHHFGVLLAPPIVWMWRMKLNNSAISTFDVRVYKAPISLKCQAFYCLLDQSAENITLCDTIEWMHSRWLEEIIIIIVTCALLNDHYQCHMQCRIMAKMEIDKHTLTHTFKPQAACHPNSVFSMRFLSWRSPMLLRHTEVLMPRIVTQSNQPENYVFVAPSQVDLVVILRIKWWECKVRDLNACETVMLASTGEARWCRLDKQEHSLRKSKARSCR